jgi:para-nitrobenzyl esterase
MAKAHADAGASAYLYEFDYVPTSLQKKYAAAPHASELPFVFDTLDRYLADPSAQDMEVARRMANAWVQFARTGNPATADLPEWQPQDSTSSTLMRINQWGGDMASVRNLDAIRALSEAAVVN